MVDQIASIVVVVATIVGFCDNVIGVATIGVDCDNCVEHCVNCDHSTGPCLSNWLFGDFDVKSKLTVNGFT